MEKISSILLALCVMLGAYGTNYGNEYAEYIESEVDWGIGIEDFIEANQIADYEIHPLTDTVTILHETIIENEYEDSIFVNGQYVGGIYDIRNIEDTMIGNLYYTLHTMFGYYAEGGGERMLTIMNTLIPGQNVSSDDFVHCAYAEIPEKGYFGCVFTYDLGSYALVLINEELLFSLSGVDAPVASSAEIGVTTIGGGLNNSGSGTVVSGATIGGGL